MGFVSFIKKTNISKRLIKISLTKFRKRKNDYTLKSVKSYT